MSKIGVQVNVIKSGVSKDSVFPFRAMTEGGRGMFFERIIDEYYWKFSRRGVPEPEGSDRSRGAAEIADGRIYTARQALDLKLIDEIGYFDDAFHKARALASLDAARLVSTPITRRPGPIYTPGSWAIIHRSIRKCWNRIARLNRVFIISGCRRLNKRSALGAKTRSRRQAADSTFPMTSAIRSASVRG